MPILYAAGVRQGDEKTGALYVDVGYRAQKKLRARLSHSLERCGLDMRAVELGITDGLAGLECPAHLSASSLSGRPNTRAQSG